MRDVSHKVVAARMRLDLELDHEVLPALSEGCTHDFAHTPSALGMRGVGLDTREEGSQLHGSQLYGSQADLQASSPTFSVGATPTQSDAFKSCSVPSDASSRNAALAAAPASTDAPVPPHAPAPAKKSGVRKLGGLKSLLSKAVANEGVVVPTSTAPVNGGGEPSSSDFASLVKAAVKEFSCPGSGLSIKSAHVAVEDACSAILALYADEKSNVLRTIDVDAAVAKYEQAALDEERAANGTSLSAQIGEVLSAKGAKKLDDLVKEWDPNSDASAQGSNP